ncbi:MAG: hypothetical protein HYY16_19955 [Planctomycetes bacterium]|nr:hypothetical protein [Planctomycetota bacterium]
MLYLRKHMGRPQALYWGCAFRHEKDGAVRRWRHHIPGRLKRRTIYRIGLRYGEKETFFRFDERRLALNDRHKELTRTLDRLRKLLARKVPLVRHPSVEAPTRRLAERLSDEPILGMHAWHLAWACAATEGEMIRFVESARATLPTTRLFPYATTNHGYVTIGWATGDQFVKDGRLRPGRRHVASRLSTELLQAYRVPRPLWGALRDVDWPMRALRREHERYARVIGRAKSIATALNGREPGTCAAMVEGDAPTALFSPRGWDRWSI